jgi:ethanolamine utilization protein EutQ
MKKLICAKDVEDLVKQGKKVFYIDNHTIVTPAAEDIAKLNAIQFAIQSNCCEEKKSGQAKICSGEVDSNMIYTVIKAMSDQGLLKGMFKDDSGKPYVAEHDKCGLKIVRGNSVSYEALDTGNPDDKVFYQEIINADDGCSMNAGFITIETCNFEWECACEELYHVMEGTLTVTVDGKVYTAQSGDSVFFPKGAKVTFGSPNKMKAFYATF